MSQVLLQRSYALDEVFVPRGFPTITLVDRSRHEKYGELMREIMQGGFINLHGDSRSGKTVNCLHITSSTLNAKERTVLVNGRSFATEAEFWNILGNAFKLGSVQIQRDIETKADEQQGGVGAKLDFLGVELWGEAKRGNSSGASTGRDQEFNRTVHEVLEVWKKAKACVIVDDFHDVEPQLQANIVFKSKAAIDFGGKMIAISIPEQAGSVVRHMQTKGQVLGRAVEIDSPLWEKTELAAIATQGFDALNVKVPDEFIDFLSVHAYKSPQLMQLYCFNFCFDIKVLQTVPGQRRVLHATIDDAKRTIEYVASKHFGGFSRLTQSEAKLKSYKLRNNKPANIYELTLLALAGIAINAPVSFKKVRERAQNLLAPKGSLRDVDVSNAIKHMNSLLKEGREREPGHEAELDLSEQHAFIKHPFFKLYLKWYLVPKHIDFEIGGQAARH